MKLPRIRPGRFKAPRRIINARIVNSTIPSSAASYSWLGWRGSGPPLGNTIAQGTLESAGRPHNSLLMKLASRPSNSPIGPTAVVMSPSDRTEETAVKRHATFPQFKNLGGMLDEEWQVVEQHIAGAAADDDPDRHP